MAVRLLLVAIMAAITFGALALYVNSTQAGTVVTFIVDDTGDLPDLNQGDGICDTSVAGPPVDCTFRAALGESNALDGPNVINFTATNTLLGAELPPITERLTIDASANVDGFSIDATGIPGGDDGLILASGSSGSVIRGLNLFGAGNDNLVICGGAGHTIGGDPDEGLAPTGQGNAFHGARGGDGIAIQPTGSNAACDAAGSLGGHTIVGNRIGTSPDGLTALGNTVEGINITGGIGARITIGGFPNLISDNVGNGINVNGGTAPVTIQNNWIGLNALGTATDAFANGEDGIGIDAAGHPAIIRNNVIAGGGLDPGGNPGNNGIAFTGGAIDNEVYNNCVGTDATCASSSGGFNADGIHIHTADNIIGEIGATAGGATAGSNPEDGGNVITNAGADCLSIEGNDNQVRNNAIGRCLGRGIAVLGGSDSASNILEENDVGLNVTPGSVNPIDGFCIELIAFSALSGANQVLNNTVANCDSTGVADASIQITSGSGNTISGNDITSPLGEDAIDVEGGASNLIASRIFRMVNQSSGDLPIDLIGGTAAEGVDLNDAGDADSCKAANTNCEHNYPVFPPSSAAAGCANGIAGPFDAVRIYSKSTEGNVTTYEYMATGAADVSGAFSVCFDNTAKVTVVGTATTTAASTLDSASINSTSEFSVTEQTVQAGATPTSTATASPTITETPTITPTPEDTAVPPTDEPTDVPTATNTATPTVTQLCGDVNMDGEVNSVDASLILQFKVELISTLANMANADVNDDGEVSSVDAALILQATADLFPVDDLTCPPKS